MFGDSAATDRSILLRLCSHYWATRIRGTDSIERCFATLTGPEQPLYLWFIHHVHHLKTLEVPSAEADGEKS
jgi:hypothetical protein